MALKLKFLIFGCMFLLLFAADIVIGSVGISVSDLWNESDPYQQDITRRILFDFRIPKALTAVIAGVALSVSGLLMQTIFRNPLAGPYVLGVSSGASLGVAIFLLGSPLLGIGLARDLGVALSAWIGAAAILLVVMAVSARIKDIMAVLILGMMFGSAASAFVDVMQYFSGESALKNFVIWSMGNLGGLSTGQLNIFAACLVVGLGMSLAMIKNLNLLLLGENYAVSMGIRVRTVRGWVFAATSVLAGSATAFCGPLGFIGIAVPHIARMVFRTADHRVLLPAVTLLGANMLLLCDLISQLPGTELILPINTITALFGIPVVVLVVINSKRGRVM